jgi:hypothetical protein
VGAGKLIMQFRKFTECAGEHYIAIDILRVPEIYYLACLFGFLQLK